MPDGEPSYHICFYFYVFICDIVNCSFTKELDEFLTEGDAPKGGAGAWWKFLIGDTNMVDGTYTIQIDTPFGRKPGTVVLRTKGDVVLADIDAPIIGKQSTQGKLAGDTFTAEGTFKLGLVGKIKYSLNGKVVGDDLTIDIDTSKGHFNLTGVRA